MDTMYNAFHGQKKLEILTKNINLNHFIPPYENYNYNFKLPKHHLLNYVTDVTPIICSNSRPNFTCQSMSM